MGAYSAAVLLDAPVYYWRMNDGWGKLAIDSTNTWDLTGGSETLLAQQGPNSDGGSAFTYQGINFSTASVRAIPAVVTLECWVWTTIQDAAQHDIIAWDDVTAGGITLAQVGTNKYSFFARSTSVTDAVVQALQRWHHIVASADAVHLTLYVDGVQTAQVASGAATTPSRILAVGMKQNGTLAHPGFMSEVAVYNYALSASRVAAHYAAADQTTGRPAFRGFSPISQAGAVQNIASQASVDAVQASASSVLASVRKSYIAP